MPRKPFFRAFDGWWYAQIRVGKKRKQIKLVKGKEKEKEAYQAFCRLLAEDAVPPPSTFLVCNVCDLFLQHSERHHEPETFEWYEHFLQNFCGQYGRLAVADLKPFHVNRWLDQHEGWNSGGRRHAVGCVKRAFHWAEEEGLIPQSPIRRVKKPAVNRRERIITDAEKIEIMGAIRDQPFRDFVFAMQETGCRPSEVSRLTSEHVDLELGIWTFAKHKTKKKTKKPRIVYLSVAMLELTKKLLLKYPQGPLFRGPRGGRAFSRNNIRCRFRRLREKLPHLKGVVSYCYRHGYITDALVNGVPAATVAELVGHKDIQMIQNHYSHLAEKTLHLRKAAEQARRGA